MSSEDIQQDESIEGKPLGRFGTLVLPRMQEKRFSQVRMAELISMRREQFIRLLHGEQRSLMLSIEQAVEIADLLSLDPVAVIESYFYDSIQIYDSSRLYTSVYHIFKWYQALLGKQKSDEEVVHDLATLLYLHKVYEHVRARPEVYKAFVGTQNAFMEVGEEAKAPV